jgi:hypothetical protein
MKKLALTLAFACLLGPASARANVQGLHDAIRALCEG